MNVLVVGKAKTGTTVISKTIQHSIPGAGYHLEPKEIGFFENPRLLEQPQVVKIIFEHWSGRPFLRNAIVANETTLKFHKVVTTIRDPRDEMLSRMFYLARALAMQGLERRKMEQWLCHLRRKEQNPQGIPVIELMARQTELFGRTASPDLERDREYFQWATVLLNGAYAMKYEAFMRGELEGLSNYLERPLSDSRDCGRLNYTRRSAKIDNWRRLFTPQDVEHFQPIFGPMLQEMGYDDWELAPVDHLEEEEGSGYVQNMVSEFYETVLEAAEVG